MRGGASCGAELQQSAANANADKTLRVPCFFHFMFTLFIHAMPPASSDAPAIPSSPSVLLPSFIGRLNDQGASLSRPARLALSLLGALALIWLMTAAAAPSGSGGLSSSRRWHADVALPALGAEICAAASGGAGGATAAAASASAKRPHLATAFSTIYKGLLWGAEGEGSGAGSTLRATSGTRALVEMLVWRHRVTRLLDAPCGTSHWWPPLLRRIRSAMPCFDYTGLE